MVQISRANTVKLHAAFCPVCAEKHKADRTERQSTKTRDLAKSFDPIKTQGFMCRSSKSLQALRKLERHTKLASHPWHRKRNTTKKDPITTSSTLETETNTHLSFAPRASSHDE
jgi:hypothetical protein